MNHKFLGKSLALLILKSVILLIILIFPTYYIFAGDIPEGLLELDNAVVYIGELKDISDNRDLTFIEKVHIKGEFEENSEDFIKSESYFDNFTVGKTYLVSYAYGDMLISPWILEVEGSDPETFTIKDGSDMAKRMESYIHEGRFTKADSSTEEENISPASKEAETKGNDIVSQFPTKEEIEQINNSRKHIAIAFVFIAFFVILFIIRIMLKRKNKI